MPPRCKLMKRYEGLGHGRFLTFSCYRRLKLFGDDCLKDAFVDLLRKQCHAVDAPVRLVGWVVMPEHVHLLCEPVSDATIAPFCRRLKWAFARMVLTRWRALKAPVLAQLTTRSGEERFWQAGGGFDRNLRSREEMLVRLVYVHHNPVKRELAATPEDWPWPSARWYAGRAYDGPRLHPPE